MRFDVVSRQRVFTLVSVAQEARVEIPNIIKSRITHLIYLSQTSVRKLQSQVANNNFIQF